MANGGSEVEDRGELDADGVELEGGESGGAERELMVVENLSPEQQEVVQKLMKSVVGDRLSADGGDWLLDEVELCLLDAGMSIRGLTCEQSGQPSGGRGKSLMEKFMDGGLTTYYNTESFKLTVVIPLDRFKAISWGDFAVLFGEDLAMKLALDAVVGAVGSDVRADAALAVGVFGGGGAELSD